MAAEEAAKELEERTAAGVSRKLRTIDHVCAVAFLAEYISRQRKADEPKEPTTDSTPSTMSANETKAPECPEYKKLSYAGTRLENYLCTRKTDECYTLTAITQAVDCIKDNARCMRRPDFYETIAAMVTTFGAVKNAVFRARRLVESEGLKCSAKDIDQVTRRYAAHIVACAKYEIENAKN